MTAPPRDKDIPESDPPAPAAADGARAQSAIVASMLDGIVVMNDAGRIVDVNAAVERTLGYSRERVLGQDYAETLVPERLRDAHRRGLRDYLASGHGEFIGRRIETPILHRDGSEIQMEQSITVAAHEDTPQFTCQLRDLTERKSAERQLHLRVAQQAAVATLGQEALANQDLQPLLERAVRLVAEALDTALCQVLEFDGAHWFYLRAGVGWPEDLIGRTRTGPEGQAGYTLRVGEPVVVDDLRIETRFTPIPLLLAQGVVSGMSAVIRGPDDEPWGVLATHSRQRKQFTPEDAHFLQAVANTLATAIQRAKWEQYVVTSEARERARADELNAIMESVPAIVWIAHDAASSMISGSRSSYEFLGIPAGRNQSQTAGPDEAPTHFQMHIDGRPLATHELPVQRAARGDTVEGCELEARFTDGSRSFLFGNATPLYDEHGQPRGSVAAFVDITELKRTQQDRERLHARLEADRALMERILEQMPVGVIAVEAPSGKRLFRNPQVERLTGLATSLQQPHERRDFHARSDQGWRYTPDRWPLIRALRKGETVTGEEMEFTHPDGRTRTISASASPIRDAAGTTVAAVTTFHDITARKRREESASFLAEVTDLLSSSLDYEQTLAQIAHLAVPRLGDWCIVDVREPDAGESGIRRFAAHADPDKVALAQRLAEHDVLGAEASRGIGRVIHTGEAEWASEISDTMLREAARDEEHLRALRKLGLRSYICMPIKRRNEILGTITLIAAESGPRDMDNDLHLAEELADRVGLALDNARLYQAARREVAERERAERELRQLNDELEQRVAVRTAETEQRAAQLRALTAELAQTEQRERRRLAQVLHDHLQQLLVAGKLEIANARSKLGDGPPLQPLERTHELLDQSIQECRSLTVELSPPVLYDAGLVAGLRWLGQWMQEQHGFSVELDADDTVDPDGEDLSVLVFQAVRELLFNAVKHARVDRAEVRVRRDASDQLEIRVRDHGRGFNPEAVEANEAHDHFGLFSIRERSARIGGELEVRSAPDSGTEVVLTVPDRSISTVAANGDAALGANEASTQDPVAHEAAPPDVVRVVLADDHEIVRAGLVSALRGHPDIEIVGEAGDGRTAVDLVRRTRPSVAILDVTMPGMNGIEATRAITGEYPDVRVIGLSVHDSDDIAAAMRDAGAIEFVNKAAASDRLLAVIRGVAPQA